MFLLVRGMHTLYHCHAAEIVKIRQKSSNYKQILFFSFLTTYEHVE